MDSTTKQLNIKVVSEGLDETIAKVKELGNTVHDLSSKKTTQSVSVSQSKQEAKIAKQTSTNLKKSASSLSKILISLISIRKLSNFFRESLDESSSWIENLNLFEVALDDCTEQGLEFTKTMSEAFGLDQNQLIEYMGLFNQMAQAIGNSTDIAYKMSEALTALGLDISSLYNISVESAMSKLRSGIAGQVKPVRELGLDITAQSLDKYLREDLGLDMTSKMLYQSQKQLLRTIMIIQQTNNAWGDLSKTINTFSNQQKILTAQITQLKRAFGDLLIGTINEETQEATGIAVKALYYINGLLMALVEIIRTFIPEATNSGFKQVEDSVGAATDGIEEMEEKLNSSLLSFDKFNTLSNNNANGKDWISELLEKGFLEEYDEYMGKFEESMNSIQNKATEIKEQILQWLGYSKDVNGEWKFANNESLIIIRDLLRTIQSVVNALRPVIKDFVTYFLKNFLNNVKRVLPLILQYIEAIIPHIVEILTKLLPLIIKINDTIMPLFMDLFEKFLPQTIKMVQDFTKVLSVVIDILSWIVDLINKIASKETWVNVGNAILTFFKIIWMAIKQILDLLLQPIYAIRDIVSGVKSSFNVSLFANGGYPETGQMFIANEKGPELVGNIGGRTAVANNDMIVKAIEQASYRGIVAGLSANGGTKGEIDFRGTNTNYLAKALAEPMVVALRQLGYKVNKA